MILSDRDGGLGVLFTCASTDVIGAPVRISGINTVTTADASDQDRSQVMGFIITKPTPTTCYITNYLYYSATSGFSGFSGVAGTPSASGYGNPVYLTNVSGFSGSPGTFTKVLGESISPREAILRSDPITAVTPPPIFGFRNKIINGAMDIWQRGTALSTISSGNELYWADRFCVYHDSNGTIQQALESTDKPTYAQCGAYINNVHRVFASVGDSSLTGDQRVIVFQRIEGFNCKELYGGYTFSFWIKAPVIGTISVWAYDYGAAQSYLQTVPVSTSWEKKVVTVPANSSGTKVLTTTSGILIALCYGCSGSSSVAETTANLKTWLSGSKQAWNQQTNLFATNSNSIYTTLWQVEAGPVPTPFEHRPYGTELLLCQRYCYVLRNTTVGERAAFGNGVCDATTQALISFHYPVPMRGEPTLLNYTSQDWDLYDGFSTYAISAAGLQLTSSVGLDNCLIVCTSSGLTQGRPAILFSDTTAAREIWFSAEL